MNELPILSKLESMLNRGSVSAYILNQPIYKGLVGSANQFKFVINSNDHEPPHIHIAVNNKQIAKYDLLTGEPITSNNPRLDKIVSDWLRSGENQQQALKEWTRFHGN